MAPQFGFTGEESFHGQLESERAANHLHYALQRGRLSVPVISIHMNIYCSHVTQNWMYTLKF